MGRTRRIVQPALWTLVAALSVTVVLQAAYINRLQRLTDEEAPEAAQATVEDQEPRILSLYPMASGNPKMSQPAHTSSGDRFVRFELGPRFGGVSRGFGYRPTIEMEETTHGYRLRVGLPQTAGATMDVRVQDRVLVLEGVAHAKGRAHRQDRQGRFHHKVELPSAVKPDSLRTDYVDGVFIVSIERF